MDIKVCLEIDNTEVREGDIIKLEVKQIGEWEGRFVGLTFDQKSIILDCSKKYESDQMTFSFREILSCSLIMSKEEFEEED